MKETKLHSIFLTAAIAYELGGDFQRVFRLESVREAGQGRKDLSVMSTASEVQMENLSKVLLQDK